MLGVAIPVWILIAGIVSAGSLAVAIQPVSDEKIHIQDTPGKLQTNVPVGAARSFSPIPVEWDTDTDISVTPAANAGSTIQTSQKVTFNIAAQVASDTVVELLLDNRSDDQQIVIFRAGSAPQVLLDMQTVGGSEVTVLGLIGHNEWLASIEGLADGEPVELVISATDPGFYPLVVELERVG
jgi:hypothetical protein